ncbi:MAG: dipicolinate synthase subunit DpsA, partial [Acutalibacteraceae bacterium]
MPIQKNFGIIGGDFRQIYLAEKFLSSGYGSILWGFNKLDNSKLLMQAPKISNLISNSEYVILPLPITRDGISLNAPFSDKKIKLNEEFWCSLESKVVFGGMIPSIKSLPKIKIYDYSEREEFKILNAIPSAEGAIKIALDQSSKTIFGSKCFVAGFGRIGKILSNRLKKFGAEVTVSARKSSDLAWIKALGYKPLILNKNAGNLDYDFI